MELRNSNFSQLPNARVFFIDSNDCNVAISLKIEIEINEKGERKKGKIRKIRPTFLKEVYLSFLMGLNEDFDDPPSRCT